MTDEVDMQQLAIAAIRQGHNIFLNGSGGVGKSWVIKQVTDFGTLLTAPTGIAALNIKGVTCHKAFKLPVGLFDEEEHQKEFPWLRKMLRHVNRIIIDEVGMLRADYFDLIDSRLRVAKGNNKPFGGIQMVVVGDLWQLEPIVTQQESEMYFSKYDTAFCFGAKCWDFKMFELTKVYRQSDEQQIALLNSLRKGSGDIQATLDTIAEMSLKSSEGCLHLCAYKSEANLLNKEEFHEIDAPIFRYDADVQGYWSDSEKLVDDVVKLKVGARVLICANDLMGQYVNGDRGVIEALTEWDATVKLSDGRSVVIEPFSWEKYKYTVKPCGGLEKEVDGTYTQIPLLLGWALSIHKSQSMTLDKVSVEVGKGCFSHGQLYTALSRVKDLRNLHIATKLSAEDLIYNKDVRGFYENK